MLHFDDKNNNEITIEEIDNQIQRLKLKKTTLQKCAHFGLSDNVAEVLMQEINEMNNKQVGACLEVFGHIEALGFNRQEA